MYPQPVATRSRARRGMAWKLQGADPLDILVVTVAQYARPGAGRDGGSAGRARGGGRSATSAAGESASGLPGRDHHRISVPAGPLRISPPDRGRPADRPAARADATFCARPRSTTENTGEKLVHWQRRLLARYSRNLARMTGARCAASSISRWRRVRSWTTTTAGKFGRSAEPLSARSKSGERLETVNLSGEEVWLNTKRIRMRRRLPRPKQRFAATGLKPRKKEKFPASGPSQLNGTMHLLVSARGSGDRETTAASSRRKAKSILSEERARVEPFTTSCSTASISARRSATGTRGRSTCASQNASRARSARWW